ncbi:MAG: GAF domain-containing sensor histidine kinase [Patescibacteria group bacterium]|nr:GAF domain-containing sensor histidine kinase [Patescibacteria group bacterium]
MVGFIYYAISQYRLMDIRLIVARTLVFGLIVLLLVSLYSVLSVIIASFFESLIGFRSNILVGLVMSILIAAGYQPLRRIIERSTDKFLYKKTYDPDKLLSQISEVTSSILDLKNLLASIAKTLGEAFHFQKVGIVLLDKDSKLEILHKDGFKAGVAEQLIAFPDVVKILQQELKQTPGILVIDEMVTQFENGEFQPVNPVLLKALHDNDIALIIPLFVQENLIGVLALGNKKSGDTYNNQDINTLKIIGGQAGIAIENARLYDELKDFNVKLEEEVRRKTAELRKANANLKQLDKAKSEFISIASHQLRTPLTVIKGYISMMKEGSFGPVPDQIMQNLDKVYLSNERLIGLVENLLDISRIESGRQEFIWSKVDAVAKAKEIVETLKNNAEQKGLKLILVKPEGNIPMIVADDAKLHEVMMNFIDNSIKYTKEGKIEVILRANPKGMVTFCVKDTGIGVSKDIQEKLFQKFTRGKDSFRIHTEGVGLGLYVAKMLIDAHKGKIWVDSDGEGKGSQFCFSVPIAGPGNVKVEEKAPVLTK